MYCGAKLKNGNNCRKHGMLNGRCRLHGGLSPKGQDHWNFSSGKYTKERRRLNKEAMDRIKDLKLAMIQLGMIEG
jgi:hypothetical protein